MPQVVVPIAFTTLVMILFFAYKRRNFTESLPFIITQTNTIYCWTTLRCLSIYEKINGPTGCQDSYSHWILPNLFGKGYMVDSLSIFMYTWVFLDVVVQFTEGYVQKSIIIYKYFSAFSVPIVTYSLYFG